MASAFGLALVGLLLLTAGAELFVRGASRLAASFGMPPLVIGLTIVALGTSAPELLVSTVAVTHEQYGIALGNVIGSNIFNVLFILGISSIIVPLTVSRQIIRWDIPVMIAASVVLFAFCADLSVTRWEAFLLLIGIVAYVISLLRLARRERVLKKDEFVAEYGGGKRSWREILRAISLLIVGLGLLVYGSKVFVAQSILVARLFGVSEAVIGLTLVAAGTSMPEVATSVVAAIKGERDIAVGNIIGSNIFNILGILGFAGLFAPGGMIVPAEMLAFDLPVMTAVAFLCLPLMFTALNLARWEGGLLLALYVAYIGFLYLRSQQNLFAVPAGEAFFEAGIPLLSVLLLVSIWANMSGSGEHKIPAR